MKTEKFVSKSYKLTRNVAPLSYLLPTRNTKRFPLLHFNEETGQNRALRYARNQKSIYEDEQDGNIILEPIVFEDGFLYVTKNNQILQEFLSLHPLNGKRFVEIDKSKDAAIDVERLNIEVDALIEARKLNIEQVETVSRVLFSADTSTISTAELKRDILVFAKKSPKEFLNVLVNPTLKLEAKIQEFFDNGILTRKGKGAVHFNTKSNKKRMLTIPSGEDEKFVIASYLKSDDGIEALKLLEKSLEIVE